MNVEQKEALSWANGLITKGNAGTHFIHKLYILVNFIYTLRAENMELESKLQQEEV